MSLCILDILEWCYSSYPHSQWD